MITRIDRYVTDVDGKEHVSYCAAEDHIVDLCRSALDRMIMRTKEAKEFSSRGHIISMVSECFNNKKSIISFIEELEDITRGIDEGEEA